MSRRVSRRMRRSDTGPTSGRCRSTPSITWARPRCGRASTTWFASACFISRTGSIRTWARTLPFELQVKPGGEVEAQLGEPLKADGSNRDDAELRALVNEVRWEKGVLSGRFAGNIPTPDVSWVPHTIAFDLRL